VPSLQNGVVLHDRTLEASPKIMGKIDRLKGKENNRIIRSDKEMEPIKSVIKVP